MIEQEQKVPQAQLESPRTDSPRMISARLALCGRYSAKFDSGEYYRGLVLPDQSPPAKQAIAVQKCRPLPGSEEEIVSPLLPRPATKRKNKSIVLMTSAGTVRKRTFYDSADYYMELDELNRQYSDGSIDLQAYRLKVSEIYSKKFSVRVALLN